MSSGDHQKATKVTQDHQSPPPMVRENPFEETPELLKRIEGRRVWSFSGAGWLGMYHVGAAKALLESNVIRWKRIEGFSDSVHRQTNKKLAASTEGGKKTKGSNAKATSSASVETEALPDYFAGASAGSFVATLLGLEMELDLARDSLLKMHENAQKSWRCYFRLRELMSVLFPPFQSVSEHPNWTEAFHERVGVAVTTLPKPQTKMVTRCRDFHDLSDALKASSAVPVFGGLPFKLRDTDQWVSDGGLTEMSPLWWRKDTIVVSPFWWHPGAQVVPHFLPLAWCFFPPSDPVKFASVSDVGYNCMLDYLAKEKMISAEEAESRRRHVPEEFIPDPLYYRGRAAVGTVMSLWLMRKLRRRIPWRRVAAAGAAGGASAIGGIYGVPLPPM